jgi:hypothetical protein
MLETDKYAKFWSESRRNAEINKCLGRMGYNTPAEKAQAPAVARAKAEKKMEALEWEARQKIVTSFDENPKGSGIKFGAALCKNAGVQLGKSPDGKDVPPTNYNFMKNTAFADAE